MKALGILAVSCSIRGYRLLLRVYPRAFLIEFEDLLCQAFEDLSLRALQRGGMFSLVALWARTLADLFVSALAQRVRNNSDWRFRVSWVEACTLGIPLGAALVFLPLLLGAGFLWPISRTLHALLLSNSAFSMGALASLVSIVPAWLQSRVHVWKRFDRITWIVSTVLGVFSGWALMSAFFTGKFISLPVAPYLPLLHLGGFALCGSVLGLFQMTVLAIRSSRAWAWLPACTAGMIAVGFETTAIEGLLMGGHSYRGGVVMALGALIVAMVGGAVFGLLTATPLEWILESRNLTEDFPGSDKDSRSRIN